MYRVITRPQNHNAFEISPYLFHVLTSRNTFITNFDPRMDSALHQLRGVHTHKESSLVSTWLGERDGRRKGEGRKNTVKIHSITVKQTIKRKDGIFRSM